MMNRCQIGSRSYQRAARKRFNGLFHVWACAFAFDRDTDASASSGAGIAIGLTIAPANRQVFLSADLWFDLASAGAVHDF